jgi:hypothetical protein
MANEIVGFGVWKFFPLVILSELIIQCVIRFGRFMRILKHQWKW